MSALNMATIAGDRAAIASLSLTVSILSTDHHDVAIYILQDPKLVLHRLPHRFHGWCGSTGRPSIPVPLLTLPRSSCWMRMSWSSGQATSQFERSQNRRWSPLWGYAVVDDEVHPSRVRLGGAVHPQVASVEQTTGLAALAELILRLGKE